MGTVLALCVSARRGERKIPVSEAELAEHYGIRGDAHAGDWHRQVSLLAQESVHALERKGDFHFQPGDFAENILTEGICLRTLSVGTRLRLGTVLLEVTQIGKECHQDCAIRKAVGDCVMPREGIFAKVLRGGVLHPGDEVEVLSAPAQ